MAPFDSAAEHEFLVNMYKLRGSFVSHGVDLGRGEEEEYGEKGGR